ncbi:protein phosphatase type 1 complex subunit Hex2/Reg1 [Xylariaceae sp. FL1272]|nr:protein phosphatase type 1 complex subunit Hex2/Reg1 [Xylariaceae sp. FL1272]
MAAVVLTSEETGLFSSSSLRRSHSQSNFRSTSTPKFRTSASTSRINDLFRDNYHQQPVHIDPGSNPSSAPSSPDATSESVNPPYTSTPVTNLSLDGQCEDDADDQSQDALLLSEYGDNPYFMSLDELEDLEDLEPPPSPRTGDSYTVSPTDQATSSSGTSRPGSPVAVEQPQDDTAVKQHPTQHVDYLSHDWQEEDIWSSWRYIISKRREYANAPRLENASWRTWMKSKYNLKTISPETLNWLKDCDVTWLYGPLQTGQRKMLCDSAERSSTTLSRSDSFVHKKPILKKRSMSEVMLQRSLSSSSLLKQATAVVQAQQKDGTNRIGRPILSRAHTDLVTFPFSERRRSRANTSLYPSNDTSGLTTPSTERKHIHFDEQVKQCIAVEVKGDDDDDDDPCHWRHDESESEEDAIMMKPMHTRKKPIFLRKKPAANSNGESKTIAMLPSTTLKYRADSPVPTESALKHSTVGLARPTIASSPSQETIRPASRAGSGGLSLDDEDDHEPKENVVASDENAVHCTRSLSVHQSTLGSDLDAQPAGMRRTESGMFMPYEESEAQANEGIMGRVIETVNTARDIAHVIWNVGWRR